MGDPLRSLVVLAHSQGLSRVQIKQLIIYV
jgi:hypothetical protein